MKRLEEHETFEMRALQWLASKRFLGPLVMGGGTMLRLCHELPRYSIDMDFWFYRETESVAFYQRLSEAMQREWDVTDVWNKHYSILLEIRRAKGAPRLKIEIRKDVAPRGSSEQKIAFSPHFPEQVLVRGFTLKQMLRNKVLALVDRGEIRDAFDIEFMLRMGITMQLAEEEKEAIVKRIQGFKKKDFDVKLGSVLLPNLRKYYREHKFEYLEQRLAFQEWKKP
jgi:predicted nucleotidyltransferase component of viral defense system